MKKNKKQMIISITAIVLIVVLILGATYAYFAAQYGDGASTNITVNTSTVDNLTFATGDEISFTATQSNFATGAGNLSGDTYASATLVANNETNSASANYYVQVYIGGNTFEYTTADETAELLLVVTDPSGSVVTSLSGLTYTTVTDGKGETVSGFDITTYNGIITIADEYEITSTGTTTQEWTIEVIFVNLSTDQSSNAGASLTGSVYIGVDQVAYHEVCNDNSLSCTVAKLTTTSSSNLYYHAYSISNDNTNSAYASGLCTYDGDEVLSYANWDTSSVTETTCASSYKVTDPDGTLYYYDSTFADYYYNEPVSVTWSGSACVTTTDSTQVYTWYGYDITEEQCSGYAYQYADDSWYYLVTVEEVVGEYTTTNVATAGAQDNSYRYSGGDYQLTTKATDAGYTQIATSYYNSGIVDFYCNGSKSYVGNTCSTSYSYYYTLAYDGNSTQYSTYKEALEQAVSDGYMTNNNVNNYVCFGSDDETCPEDSLYRIIGVFQNDAGEYQIKLIKATYADTSLLGTTGDYFTTSTSSRYSGNLDSTTYRYSYYWNKVNYSTAYNATGYYNVWSYSQLNTVNLNTNYWNTLESKWQDMVATTSWKVGGNDYNSLIYTNAKTAYIYEIENPNSDVETEYSAKVGLMYVSDYGYAASPTYWTIGAYYYNGYNYNLDAYLEDWMYGGVYEWTISRSSSATNLAFSVYSDGDVYYNNVNDHYRAVRPVLYLESSTTYLSGSGLASDPYIIS